MKRIKNRCLLSLVLAVVCTAVSVITPEFVQAATEPTVDSFETELNKFPVDYREKLMKLHTAHPNWVFIAKNLSLDWNTAVAMEASSSADSSKCYSLLPNYSGKLFLSKASSDYNPTLKKYIVKDGSDWVSASRPAVAYFMDPRNFLTEEYVFQFEATSYNSTYHTLAATEAVLKGTDMANRKISYINTSGATVSTNTTYAQAIYAAGVKYGISPIMLASKARQETGCSLKDPSNSGNYSYNGVSYRGYYNPYNIASNGTSAAQGSAVALGLTYAMGGANRTETSYGRPWDSPEKAFFGGAEYMADIYLKNGQNTIYFKKFNTVSQPYYSRQYMQNLYATQSESTNMYNSYKNCGILDSKFVFYIPVYKNMPSYGSSVKISKTTASGKTTAECNLRKGPSTAYTSLGMIPKGATVTLLSCGTITDTTVKRDLQIRNPYWLYVQYGAQKGYISLDFFSANTSVTMLTGSTYQLSVSCSDRAVLYETSNPLVATVNSSGSVKSVGLGSCTIYALNSTGSRVDCIGVKVDTKLVLEAPKLHPAVSDNTGVTISWDKVTGAEGYYIYRKSGSGSWNRIGTVSGNSSVSYLDKTVVSGTTYDYTVKGYSSKSSDAKYDTVGVTVQYVIHVDSAFPFIDVSEDAWYYSTVRAAYQSGIMSGVGNYRFAPTAPLNRAMAVTIVHRLAGYPRATYETVFRDVPADTYYSTAVIWAAKNRVVSGYEDGTFRPDVNITREQLVTVIYNFAKKSGINGKAGVSISGYADVSQVSEYARRPMEWAVANGILSGNPQNYLNPKNNATRAEAAKMFLAFYKLQQTGR